jgi:AcrR family transcriptional regulator
MGPSTKSSLGRSAKSPVVRTRRKRGEIRTLLLESARELFSSQGFAKTTTRQIADAAGVTEVLIFRHFETKRGLFQAAIIEPFATLVSGWVDKVSARSSSGPTEELVGQFVSELYPFMLEQRDLMLTLIAAIALDPEFDHAVVQDPLTETFSILEKFAREETLARGIEDIDLAVSIGIAISMVVGVALFDPWLFGGRARRPSPARIAKEMARFMSFGVATKS